MGITKIIFALGMIGFLVSCGGSKEENKPENVLESVPPPDKGLELISKSDCVTCHRGDEVLTGPSYADIANKYAASSDTAVAYLAGKIIKGGSGVWGQVPMVPHTGITNEEAELMAKYILSFKK